MIWIIVAQTTCFKQSKPIGKNYNQPNINLAKFSHVNRSQSPLSQLYGMSGTLEKHHFNHCIMILNTPGHNIFSQLKPKTYAIVVKYIKEAILATDLAEHFS